MNEALQFIINGIARGSLYGLVAVGFSLIYNQGRVLHIAHAAIYTACAYLFYTTFTLLHLPFWLSLFISLLGTVILGILSELFVYRPLDRKNAPPAASFISSLGLYILLQNVIALIYGNQLQVLTTEPDKIYHFGEIMVGRIQIIEICASILLGAIFFLFLSSTKFGKSLKALGDNPLLATAIGMNIDTLRLAVFAIGSLFAGAASILSAFDTGLDPSMGMPVILTTLVAVIVGGVSVLGGAFLGGILVGLLQSIIIWQFSARWDSVLLLGILVIFLLFKPQGLLGVRRRVEEVGG